MSIYAARKELSMTPPYFVLDETITSVLLSAARRGVCVTLILPEKNDSRLVHYTCRSHFDELLEAGVRIFGFRGGLLHTKSAVVDGEISLFGTVNIDIRSFWLDFEVTLCVYDSQFAERLLALHQKYIEYSAEVDPAAWRRRPATERFSENLARLYPRRVMTSVLRGWFGYFKHSRPFVFISVDGFIRRRLRAILRRQQKRPGMGRCHADHKRWPNAFFAERGLFTMTEAYAQASQSRC